MTKLKTIAAAIATLTAVGFAASPAAAASCGVVQRVADEMNPELAKLGGAAAGLELTLRAYASPLGEGQCILVFAMRARDLTKREPMTRGYESKVVFDSALGGMCRDSSNVETLAEMLGGFRFELLNGRLEVLHTKTVRSVAQCTASDA